MRHNIRRATPAMTDQPLKLTSQSIQNMWATRSGCPPWPYKRAKIYSGDPDNAVEYGIVYVRHCDSRGDSIFHAATNDAEYTAEFDKNSTSCVHIRANDNLTGTIEAAPPPRFGLGTISSCFPAQYRCTFCRSTPFRETAYICDRDKANNRYIISRGGVEVASIPLVPKGGFAHMLHVILYVATLGLIKTTVFPTFPAAIWYCGNEDDAMPVFAIWLVASIAIGGALFRDAE